MPFFLDRHDLEGATPEDVAQAHKQDVEVQDRHHARYLSYWFDYGRQTAFCLVEAPTEDAAEAVHREAHGMLPHNIIEIDPHQARRFLGEPPRAPVGQPYVATAFRAILFTDIVGSTELTSRLGDAASMQLIRRHDQIVRRALELTGGSEVKHTGDGIMASFTSVSRAVECAIDIQRALSDEPEERLSIRIGVAAGEPVTENDDLFGSTVQLAARLCATADPGRILVSTAVRELSLGKGFTFSEQAEADLKGFSEPVRAYLVDWQGR